MPKRIYIGGVTVTTTDATINSTFAPYGTIVSAAVNRDSAGQSLGNANVEYTTDAAGTAAIAAKHGTVLDGSTISVQEAR
jgi:RNA recognition motif-containing protein